MLFNPKKAQFEHLDEQSREIMKKTIDFFETKGKKKLKEDHHERIWYEDFLQFLKKEGIFATLLTPAQYGGKGCRWDTFRNMDFNEILSFYSLAHWYAWQVTILGLGPIWMGKNEAVKQKTARLLEEGGIFAFGLSEKEHGADLYASDMAMTPLGDGQYRADGGKYYIGNGNQAALVSTFAKNSETDEFVFFVVDSQHENYDCVQNVVNSQMYVSEYALHGYPLTDDDILTTGTEAWDSSLNTINVGKYNLGWASIGICTHAFYEAINHAAGRFLFKHYVVDFPHIRQLFVDAYARLCAMRMFASRASDYMRSASADDRRYLLYNPMVKMKVTTQGEEVINLLWDVIAAKGFEKDTYFEMAASDIRALPKLEGTVHVNMALIVKFMANYFFNPGEFPQIGKVDAAVHDEFLFNQGPTKGLGKIQFHDYNIAYSSLDLPNIGIFREQIALLVELLLTASPNQDQVKDIDFLLNLGELFTLVAYGQLLIEKAKIDAVSDDLMDQIFDFMVRDFSKFALQLYSKASSTPKQMELCMKIIKKPVVNPERFNRIWEKHVYSLKETYRMND
ncbi:MAG: acyl-CoA dehydrogenase family protein [Desulfobacteraceae bacterium]|jgi:acyl-CoA dehydrogenase|nr:acyl-CoA dehydrogenase family protein [Desulfobacteraceae bacterium]